MLSIFESFFPILSVYIIDHVGAIYGYALSLSVATIIFLAILAYKKKLHELFLKEARWDLFLTTFFITLLFLLMFIGLQYTTVSNMAVIIILQLFFSYIYFNLFGKEKLTKSQTFGAFLMGVGAIVVLYPEDFGFNIGDILILLAAAIAPIANLYQKRARAYVSSESVLAFRSVVALPILFILAYMIEKTPSISQILDASLYIITLGILVMTLAKILWVEALHLISITKLSAFISFIPLFTLFFAYILLHDIPSTKQLIGVVPILIGSYFITKIS